MDNEITGEFPDLPDGWTFQSLPDEPETVPLTIYLDDRKYIVGKATVIGRKVHAQIKPAEGRELEELVKRGVIESMSVHFSTRPPAQPQLPYGEISPGVMGEFWKREEVSFVPTSPIRHIPKMEGLSADYGILDESTPLEGEANVPQQGNDKFPYGPA